MATTQVEFFKKYTQSKRLRDAEVTIDRCLDTGEYTVVNGTTSDRKYIQVLFWMLGDLTRVEMEEIESRYIRAGWDEARVSVGDTNLKWKIMLRINPITSAALDGSTYRTSKPEIYGFGLPRE